MRPMRHDPAGAKSIERSFYHHIESLITSYNTQCRYFVGRHQGRSLESPVSKLPLNAGDLIESIQYLADITIVQRAEMVALAAAHLSYLHGQKWADKALSLQGLTNPATGERKPFFLPPDQAAIARIQARNMMEIKGMSDELAKRMSRSLVEGFEKGETINLLTRRVKEVTDFGKQRAVTIARTETMRAVNSATKDRYERAGVTKVEWLTALDSRQCDECESLHGEVFDIDKVPDLPVHPNCRCTVIPVIESD